VFEVTTFTITLGVRESSLVDTFSAVYFLISPSLFCYVIVVLCLGFGSIPYPALVHISSLRLLLSLTEKKPFLGLLSCVKYLYSAILLNLLGDLHETPPTIVCEDIMIKYWRNLIWQCVHDPPNRQIKFPAKFSSYTVIFIYEGPHAKVCNSNPYKEVCVLPSGNNGHLHKLDTPL